MVHIKYNKFCIAALLIAIGIILPFFTMQIKTIGKMLLPMHFPVLLSGLLLGGNFGLLVGVITPILRSILFGMPILFPDAISMCFELGTYGLVSGLFYYNCKDHNIFSIYKSLIIAMISGRVVLIIVKLILVGVSNNTFSFMTFFTQTIISGLPGIILQLILIPIIVKLYEKVFINE